MDALDALVQIPFFRGVARERVEFLAPSLRRKEVRKGGFAWVEGSAATGLIIVVQGWIEASRTSSSGEHIVVEMNGPGDVGGLPALLIEGATRMTQGKALEDSVVLNLDREAFFAILEREPTVMRRVLDHVAREARTELQMFSDRAFLDLRSRVASKLFDLAHETGEPTKDGMVTVKISQRALAAMIAASREKVNRALGRLAAEGFIRQEPGRIMILQRERMRELF